ncbi:hypothetical protein Acid345_1132 [Candidatus Koribacter versatilis Ellin345]|uniref:Uncharacterized protein n=1 Tax=Koribacter versatilis (strain Ellin345) TaxID=204669 RepID=Q1ISL5_KORVE|nr:hypothetical protein Acid345_1132 [Candidatus Koribacter versatilis Ellin345]
MLRLTKQQLKRGPVLAQSAEQIGQDLTAVHSFYLFLLESALAHEVPVPPSIAHDRDVLLRFVSLLDLATTPQMIRDGFKSADQRGAGEALLRFFATKSRRRREDRDKVDVIATALYRFLVPPDAGELAEDADYQRTLQFEEELRRIYRNVEIEEPATEHMQLVREFQFLRDEVNDFRHFDELIDSGVIQKVRDIKQTLDSSFLHPSVLAPLASYNVFFGQRFDLLFKRATQEVKSFAHKVQADGGSIMSRVDGDVIVKHLADVDEGKILNEEYSRAQENLRHVSKLKKAVDNRRFGKGAPLKGAVPQQTNVPRVPPPTAVPQPEITAIADSVAPAPKGQAQAAPVPQRSHRLGPEPPAYSTPRSSSSVAEVELQKLSGVQMTIRSFVRAADPTAAQVVPLPNGNITLTVSEVEAFRADYGNEKSFRADFVAALMQMAALDARLLAEWQEFQRTRYTAYNWKPHADALAHLLNMSRTVSEHAMQLMTTAHQRGLTDKVAAVTESIEKVRMRAQAAAEALQSIGTGE